MRLQKFVLASLIATTAIVSPVDASGTSSGRRCSFAALRDQTNQTNDVWTGEWTLGPIVIHDTSPDTGPIVTATASCVWQTTATLNQPVVVFRVSCDATAVVEKSAVFACGGALTYTKPRSQPLYLCTHFVWTTSDGRTSSLTDDSDPTVPGAQCALVTQV